MQVLNNITTMLQQRFLNKKTDCWFIFHNFKFASIKSVPVENRFLREVNIKKQFQIILKIRAPLLN